MWFDLQQLLLRTIAKRLAGRMKMISAPYVNMQAHICVVSLQFR
jgi:hypothetical protein